MQDYHRAWNEFTDDEKKIFILWVMGNKNPNKEYYGDAIKSLKKKGYLEDSK